MAVLLKSQNDLKPGEANNVIRCGDMSLDQEGEELLERIEQRTFRWILEVSRRERIRNQVVRKKGKFNSQIVLYTNSRLQLRYNNTTLHSNL